MEDNVSRAEKGKWFDELLALQENISKENYKSYVGTTHRVLCDEILGCGKLSGKNLAAVDIQFEGSPDLLGQFVTVKVDSFTNVLNGTII
jgi:tRNA-2-methylthio-N6-dimethylallyladenosine synthase